MSVFIDSVVDRRLVIFLADHVDLVLASLLAE